MIQDWPSIFLTDPLALVFNTCDDNKNNVLEKEEIFGGFCRSVLTQVIEDTNEEILKAFNIVDLNNDQIVSKEEAEFAASLVALNRDTKNYND